MKQEINLESIILEAYSCKDMAEFKRENDISVQMIKEICFEACNQVLDLAAENAKLSWDSELSISHQQDYYIVNKDSILEIKGWIK